MAQSLGLEYVSLLDSMRDKRGCLLYDKDRKSIQWDNGHLTPAASVQLMELAVARGDLRTTKCQPNYTV